jgi:hypothetical protein
VTLCDAGPLVAPIVESDPHHDRCVAAGGTLGLRRIFTLDGHFLFYRPNDTETFEVVP